MIADAESIIEKLEATGDYRVLRRLPTSCIAGATDVPEAHIGLALDVETTGLDKKRDEIIEIAMVPFLFSGDGHIIETREPFQALRQPSRPIPSEITRITGIDDDMVRGATIHLEEISRVLDGVHLIIAHNAGFDRPFVERLHDGFKTKCWACTMSEIDWADEGLETSKLVTLLNAFGFFYKRHRALSDCHAIIQILREKLPNSGTSVLAKLLDAARQPTWRIWAIRSPFEAKDILKARGYRWNGGEDGRPKSWYRDVSVADRDDEIGFLSREIYRVENIDLPVDRLTAFDRFSERA